jgi:hypothetical protein
MKTEQAFAGIEPILHCHKFAAIEFTRSAAIAGSVRRRART